MPNSNLGETKPSRAAAQNPQEELNRPVEGAYSSRSQRARKIVYFNRWGTRNTIWALVAVGLLVFGSASGVFAAYLSTRQSASERQAFEVALILTEQFNKGIQDLEAGRYEAARQRFDYVLTNDPNFPGASEKLTEVMQILYATATPTPKPTLTLTPTDTPTRTPTPTPDLRPLQELFSSVESALMSGDWNRAMDTLNALRTSDASYQVAQVDGMMFLALRNRGVDRILRLQDLEGGAYDLSLAERFGPLDGEAVWAREMVRLYMYGSAFWEAYPEQAVYYFGQVAAAAPYLTDASGWTSSARYQVSLIHYGNFLASQDEWCAAEEQYELALSYGGFSDLQATVEEAAYQCSPPTATPTITPTFELTSTPTTEILPSATNPPAPSGTPEPPQATDTPPAPTTQPAPETETPTSQPTEPPPVEPTETTEAPSPTAETPAPALTLTP